MTKEAYNYSCLRSFDRYHPDWINVANKIKDILDKYNLEHPEDIIRNLKVYNPLYKIAEITYKKFKDDPNFDSWILENFLYNREFWRNCWR